MRSQVQCVLQLQQMSLDRTRVAAEKADLENALEAEQEYIMHKLSKQVRSARLRSRCLTAALHFGSRLHEDCTSRLLEPLNRMHGLPAPSHLLTPTSSALQRVAVACCA